MKILKNNIDELMVKTKYISKKIHDDQEMNILFNFWHFFDEREAEIQELTRECMESVLYSKYYWCTKYKNKFDQSFGRDVGLDQQQYRIIEEINRRINSVDWKLIQMIEEDRAQ